MEETITSQQIQEKIKQRIVPLVFIGTSFVLLGLAAAAVIGSFQLPEPPQLIAGEYVPAEVLVKFKPGADPNAVVSALVNQKQTVYRNNATGKVVGKFDSAVKQAPENFTAQKIQLTKKSVARLLPVLGFTDEAKSKIASRPGVNTDPEQLVDKIGLDRWFLVSVNEADADVAAMIQALRANTRQVETAEPNALIRSEQKVVQPVISLTSSNQNSVTDVLEDPPNDPYYSSTGAWGQGYADQWGLYAVNAAQAWMTTTGSRKIVVAVVDGGVDYTHPDLRSNIWINEAEDINHNGCADYWLPSSTDEHENCHGETVFTGGDRDNIDNDQNGLVDDLNGMDFTFDQNGLVNSPLGPIGAGDSHGTHVAGIIGATTNNSLGMAGLCPNCQIMPIEAWITSLPSGETTALRSITYSIANGADVINMSWASLIGQHAASYNQALSDLMRLAEDLRVITVAGVGNEGVESADYQSPASIDSVIGVGSTSHFGLVSSFSNSGSTVDVVAPGGDILSLYSNWAIDDDPNIVGQNYAHFTGTSMSTPFVSALSGLMLSVNPSLTSQDIKEIIQQTAQDIEDPGFDIRAGHGLVNAEMAVAEAKRRIPDVTVRSSENKISSVSSTQLNLDILIENSSFFHARDVAYQLINVGTGEIIFQGTADDIFPYGWEWVRQTITVNSIPAYVQLVVDPANLIPETFENNNQVTITVRPVGTPLFQHLDNPNLAPGQASQINVSAIDPEGQALTYAAERLPSGSNFTNQDFSWTPDSTQIGRYRTTFSVTDPQGLSDKLPLTILVQDQTDPYRVLLNSVGDQEVRVGKQLSFTVGAAGTGSPYQTYLGVINLPAGANFNTTSGAFTWTPTAAQQGLQSITFLATNSIGREFKEEIQINVVPNHQPVWLSTVGNTTVDEGGQVSFTLNGFDVDGDIPTYAHTVLSQPSGTTFDAVLNPTTGAFTWNPTFTASGTYSIRFIASDGQTSISQDSQITVNNVITPKFVTIMSNRPFLDSILFTVGEGFFASHTLPIIPGACLDTENRCKADWAPLNFSSANIQKSDVQFLRIKMNTLNGWSAALSNTCLSSPGLPTCSVVGTSSAGNYTFDLYNNANLYFMEQDEYGNKFGTAGFTGGGVGPDWNSWMNLCAQSYSSRQGGVAINTTPFPNDFGTSQLNRLELCLVDHYNETRLRSMWTVEVHRKSMNVAPVLSPISPATVDENMPLTIQPVATDYNEDRVWYSASPLPPGAVINQFTGQVTWTPGLGQAGVYPITVTASDKHLSATQIVTVTVNRFNTAPTFNPLTTRQAIRGDDFTHPFHANDAQNDVLTYSIVSAPVGATINSTTGNFLWYVPNDYPTGSTSVVVRAQDGFGGSATVTLPLDVVIPRSGGGGGGDIFCIRESLGGKVCLNPFVIE